MSSAMPVHSSFARQGRWILGPWRKTGTLVVRSGEQAVWTGSSEELARYGIAVDEAAAWARTSSEWLAEGALVRHTVFGSGAVAKIGEYNGEPAVWIDFDRGDRKVLQLEYGVPQLRPFGPMDHRSPVNPDIACAVCGARPVVVTVGSDYWCEAHRGQAGR